MSKGNMKRRKPVYGIGINDYEGRIKIDGKHLPSYKRWLMMLQRCYDERELLRNPTYRDVEVCAEWLYFSNFKEWYDENVIVGWQLDKDLKVSGSKIYSPETCMFVPKHINLLFGDNRASRGDYPQGVCWDKRSNRFMMSLNRYGKGGTKGYYDNSRDALEAYVIAKAEYAVEVVLAEPTLSISDKLAILKTGIGDIESIWNDYTDTVSPLVERNLYRNTLSRLSQGTSEPF
ncbi:hypothetical protein ACNO7T_20970 [Vibrio campbellii]